MCVRSSKVKPKETAEVWSPGESGRESRSDRELELHKLGLFADWEKMSKYQRSKAVHTGLMKLWAVPVKKHPIKNKQIWQSFYDKTAYSEEQWS